MVAPPTHLSNGHYQWVSRPGEADLAKLPAWIPGLLPERNGVDPIPEVIYDGEGRERHLVSLAGTLRRRGLGAGTILETLRIVNGRQCAVLRRRMRTSSGSPDRSQGTTRQGLARPLEQVALPYAVGTLCD
jgi:hypothetical protein